MMYFAGDQTGNICEVYIMMILNDIEFENKKNSRVDGINLLTKTHMETLFFRGILIQSLHLAKLQCKSKIRM